MTNYRAVKIPEESYKQLEKMACEEHSEVESELVEAVNEYVAKRQEYINDPFFEEKSSGQSGLGNMAKEHDQYLYDSGDNPK